MKCSATRSRPLMAPHKSRAPNSPVTPPTSPPTSWWAGTERSLVSKVMMARAVTRPRAAPARGWPGTGE